MILERYTKQPSERKDYTTRYDDWLISGDTIFSATATVVCLSTASNTALVVEAPVASARAVTLWVSAGTSGERYKVTVKVTTVGGRVDEYELLFNIKDA